MSHNLIILLSIFSFFSKAQVTLPPFTFDSELDPKGNKKTPYIHGYTKDELKHLQMLKGKLNKKTDSLKNYKVSKKINLTRQRFNLFHQ